MKSIFKAGLLALTFSALSLGNQANAVKTPSGLEYTDKKIGDGPSPQKGDIAIVHYKGTLKDGTVFDSSYERGKPFPFHVGKGEVIAGWDEGILTMKKGGTRILIIPAKLAYGDKGMPPIIPPHTTLIFEVTLVDVKPATVSLKH